MTRADIALLVLVIGLLPFVYLYYWQETSPGEKVLIYAQNTLVKKVRLDKDQLVTVDGVLGKSTLRIENGKVRFVDSPCTARICINKGWHSHSGDFNACLPNQVSFEIIGTRNSGQFDSINF